VEKTILHVLNHCEVARQLWRYSRRHDQVLGIMTELARAYLQDNNHVMVDVRDGDYIFPDHIMPTNLRPDIVV
jgi:hypothetical protein